MPSIASLGNNLAKALVEIFHHSPAVISSDPIKYETSGPQFWGKIGGPIPTKPVLIKNKYRIEARRVRWFPIAQYEIFSIHEEDFGRKHGFTLTDHLYLSPAGLTNCTDGTYQRLFTLEEAKKIVAEEGARRSNDIEGLATEVKEYIMPYDIRTLLSKPDSAATAPPAPH